MRSASDEPSREQTTAKKNSGAAPGRGTGPRAASQLARTGPAPSTSRQTCRKKKETNYNTYLAGQLYEAKPRVDNFSQSEAFFQAVNKNIICMAERKSTAFPMQEGPSTKKILQDTPFAARGSMVGLRRLPAPDEHVAKILEADVYQAHEDSSDDEQLTDEAFRNASKEATHELIHTLNDGHIEAISESIRNYKYD